MTHTRATTTLISVRLSSFTIFIHPHSRFRHSAGDKNTAGEGARRSFKPTLPHRVRRHCAIPSPVITEASVLAYLLTLSAGSSGAMFSPLRAPVLSFSPVLCSASADLLLPFIAFRGIYCCQ